MKHSAAFRAAPLALLLAHPAWTGDASHAPPGEFYGTNCCQVYALPSSSLSPLSSKVGWVHVSSSYIETTADPDQLGHHFAARVDVPSGLLLGGMTLHFEDLDSTRNVAAEIRRYITPAAPTYQVLGTVSSTLAPGVGSASVTLSHPVDNSDSAQIAVLVSLPVSATTLRFRSVDLKWSRQVKAANPATPTFLDVPSTHVFYDAIEALAEAGITAGCNPDSTLFCPDDAVTRAQMATFLSRALGLYWAY